MSSTQATKHTPQASRKRKHSDDLSNARQSPTKKLLSMLAWFIGMHETDPHADIKKSFDAKIDKLRKDIADLRRGEECHERDLDEIFEQVEEDRQIESSDMYDLETQIESLEEKISCLEKSNFRLSTQMTQLVKAASCFVDDASKFTATDITERLNLDREMDSNDESQSETYEADAVTGIDTQCDRIEDCQTVA